MDTLAVLREFTRAGRLGEVSLASGRVRFGADFDFSAADPTGYVRGGGAGATTPGAGSAAADRYSAGALAFFAAASGFAADGVGAYMRAAREAGVPTVAVLDIKVRRGGEREGRPKNRGRNFPPSSPPEKKPARASPLFHLTRTPPHPPSLAFPAPHRLPEGRGGDDTGGGAPARRHARWAQRA